jgi:hypothetical protein
VKKLRFDITHRLTEDSNILVKCHLDWGTGVYNWEELLVYNWEELLVYNWEELLASIFWV